MMYFLSYVSSANLLNNTRFCIVSLLVNSGNIPLREEAQPTEAFYNIYCRYFYHELNRVQLNMSTFSTCTLILEHHKVVGQFSQPNFRLFCIEVAHDSIESGNYFVAEIFSNILLLVV